MHKKELDKIVAGILDAGKSSRISRRQLIQGMVATGMSVAGASAMWSTEVEAATPKKGGVFRVGKGHGQTSDSLDPGTSENGFTLALNHAIHGYLTEVAADGTLQGQLAESFEASPDATTWTFALRKGVTFHNGKEMTAEDVIVSIDHHRGEASKSAAKPIVSPIKTMKADGKHTVVFDLEAGNADFPYIVSDYHLPVMPNVGGKADWKSGIGAGAYKIKSFDPGVRLDLVKNKDYWRSDRGHFDAVQVITIVDPAARTNALISGEVDTIDRIDLKTVHLLKRRKGLAVHSIAGTQHYTFPMRTDMAPYTDNNVRMALKHAIDRQEMVDKILQGYGVVGNDHPIGPGQRFFAKDLEQRTYDPDKAKSYLKKAGHDSLTVKLQVADAAFAGATDAGSLFAETAKRAGLNIEVAREPNDGYWANVWNNGSPFCACYWGGRPTADWMFATAYESGVAWNDTKFEHDRFNKLLKQARAELDEGRRRDMYAEMQTILRDEGGTIIPMFASYVFATSDKLGYGDLASNWDMDGERAIERWWFKS